MKALLIIFLLAAAPLWAIEPDEILEDPLLEARARAISKELRCLVCQSESIDESQSTWAKDIRLLVRERLVAGDTDAQTIDFMVARYGESVLLRPRVTGANWVLWAAGPLMLLLASISGWAYVRSRARATVASDAPLSAEEQARLDDILRR
ncbi:MAG: cytochrome c-type biogenesis protein [Pseudomonadota bacterium]